MMAGSEERICIGNQSSFAAARHLDPFWFAIEHRFDAFEWFPDYRDPGAGWRIGQIDKRERLQLRDSARDHRTRISVHAPLTISVLDRDALRLFEETVVFACDVGAALINVHFELDPSLEEGQAIEAYARAALPLIERVARAGMTLAIENTPAHGPEHFNRLFAVLRARVALQRVGMCLDVGHANLYAGTRNDYLGFVDRLEPYVPIRHVHLHENYGDRDSHLVVFSGPSVHNAAGIEGLLARLRQRSFAGSIILEQWPQPAEQLLHARQRLREMLAAAPEPRWQISYL